MTPRLFTREAWAALTPDQRTLVRIRRRQAVEQAGMEHVRRYHSTDNRAVLRRAIEEGNNP